MPAAARLGDLIDTGHDCDENAPIAEGSPNVFVNGLRLSHQGAAIELHEWDQEGCTEHEAEILEGSSSVFVNGIPVARLDDAADLGVIIEGSPTVFVGG